MRARAVRRLAATVAAILLLPAGSLPAVAERLDTESKSTGCTKSENPTMKLDYSTDRMKAVFRFAKRCYPEGTFINVMAGLVRTLPDGTAQALGRGKSCDTSKTCWLAVKIPHPETELAEYWFRVDWIGLHGHARKRKTDPVSCTSTPVLAQCDEPADP